MWASKPYTMIKKVAIAQGFRLAFPDEIGGMPYTADELPDEMTTHNHKPTKPEIIDLEVEDEGESQVQEKQKKENKNYKFLKEMAKIKKEVGKEIYYEVLNAYGFKKSNEITDRNLQIKIYKELKQLANELKELGDGLVEEVEKEEKEEKQEPTPEQQKVAEKLKELFGGEEIKE